MRTVNVGMYSEIGTNEAHFKNENVQSDLKCIIGGILQLILDNQENPPLRPVYSDNIVVYPQISGPWTVAGQLRFFCNNVELKTYQQILQLFVELKEAKPDTAHQPAPNEPTKVSHHSRKRSPPPQQSSQVDPRKRPKHDPSDHQSTKLVHNADEKVAAMPRTGRDYEYPKDKLSDVEIRRRYLEEEKRLKHLSRRAQYEHSTRKM